MNAPCASPSHRLALLFNVTQMAQISQIYEPNGSWLRIVFVSTGKIVSKDGTSYLICYLVVCHIILSDDNPSMESNLCNL